MSKKIILIDAAHREETRVAVLENGILQDFDREAISVKQIKGNIYLAKITRVEQSLQAAFVDYGEERHGFLPFSDIHPDYFQLSDSEKQKLREGFIENLNEEEPDNLANYNQVNEQTEDDIIVKSYSVEEETEVYRGNIYSIYKRYNIQDVIKPGQMVLVQVNKEERGNKGASMTTYISLAGKYCVLMSNTPNKGGVSKKIENYRDRKILKNILNELEVQNDRSVIVRTAGVGKHPDEIKKDYQYLTNLWSSILEAANDSKVPLFIHAEDDIVKKYIRDIYDDSVMEVIIEGKDAYDSVKKFTSQIISRSVDNIQLYEEKIPIFNKYRVEQQISLLYEKQVFLPSGGSIVIDHTEALVAIDVNSGRATKEAGVEETATLNNMEAVKEIARQLKLRDLAGLVVIDFIDMYDQKNRRNVERALRDELQNDRARIQIGKISSFGLLELSRQRLGASFFETITQPCKACNGTGYVKSPEIVAVSILRAIRHACSDNKAGVIYIYTHLEVINYILNYKKFEISSAESNYSVYIFFHATEDHGTNGFTIKKRKGLSDNEKKEIEMKIVTGKVNQTWSYDNFYESQNENDIDESQPYSEPQENHKKFHKRKNYKNRRNYKGSKKEESKGTLDKLFSFFGKN